MEHNKTVRDSNMNHATHARGPQSDVQFNVAVIGCAGTGKSTLISSLRNRRRCKETDEQEDAVTTSTTRVTRHKDPILRDLNFFEIAGIESAKKEKAKYFDSIFFDAFDVFLVLAAGRITESDTVVCDEIVKTRKPCFFIRTKIDIDIINEQRKRGPSTESDTATKILTDAKNQIGKKSKCMRLFVVDAHDREAFDFPALEQSIEEIYTSMRCNAVWKTMTTVNEPLIRSTANNWRRFTAPLALTSGLCSCILLPGFSLGYDATLISLHALYCYRRLGLDERSVRKAATLSGVAYSSLRAVLRNAVGTQLLRTHGLLAVARFSLALVVTRLTAGQQHIRFVDTVVRAASAFAITYAILHQTLSTMERTAISTSQIAIEGANKD